MNFDELATPNPLQGSSIFKATASNKEGATENPGELSFKNTNSDNMLESALDQEKNITSKQKLVNKLKEQSMRSGKELDMKDFEGIKSSSNISELKSSQLFSANKQ